MEGVGPQGAPSETFSQNASYFQHQFFPHSRDHAQGGKQLNPLDSSDGHWAPPNMEKRPRTLEAHSEGGNWDVGAWNWDSMLFSAQSSTQRGLSESLIANAIDGNQTIETEILKLGSRDITLGSGLGSRDEPRNKFLEKETVFGQRSCLPASSDAKMHGIADDESFNVECLTLKLGGHSYSYPEGAQNSKRWRSSPPGVQHPTCQVDGCRADLSSAKDYHRRHKVCEDHSKAAKASVGRLMQRFCQQCSRFHPLQEFDEGKRSCRRRLAGHNRRRRKTQPDGAAARAYFLAEEDCASRSTGLLSLLNVLSQLQGNPNERINGPINEQDLLVDYIKKAIGTSVMANSHRSTSGAGIMYDVDALDKVPATEQRSYAKSDCGPIGDYAPVHAIGNAISSVADPHLLSSSSSSSSSAIQSLALLLHGYLNSQVPTISRPVQEALLSHLLHNQPRSHPSVEASAFEKNSVAVERTLDLPQVGNFPSSSSPPYLGRTFESGQLFQTLLESGNAVGACAAHQRLSEKFPQQSVPVLEKTCAPWGVSDSGNMEKIMGKEDLNVFRSSAATAPNSNVGLARPPSFSWTGAPEERITSQYAACNQPFPTSNAQTKGHMLHASAQKWSSSEHSRGSPYADIQDRTGRISFKLFDRSPKDFPQFLRTQILEWLSQVPTEMESYIRPGCVILTIYLSMSVKMWEELCKTLHSSLKRLLSISNSDFWCKGRIWVQVEHQTAYIVDGEVQALGLVRPTTSELLAVRPLAVVAGQPSKLVLRGRNLSAADTRVLCAYQGKYSAQSSEWLKQEEQGQGHDATISKILTEAGTAYEEMYVSFSGGPSNAIGRCFIEVEDEGVGGGFVPLIVADYEICNELHTLENDIENVSSRAASMAMENGISPEEVSNFVTAARSAIETEATHFLHDLGWIFQKTFWKMNESLGGKHVHFPLPVAAMKRLLTYAVEHDWCAVIHRLLDILFSVNVEPPYLTFKDALLIVEEVNLLHVAVRRISRPMVDLLLAYEPFMQPEMPIYRSSLGSSSDGETVLCAQNSRKLVFTPDMAGPARLTPLHVAASMKDAESMIDALTSDPFQIGLHAWNYAQDAAGQTPYSCALAHGNFGHIQMVWKKLVERRVPGQVTVNIPSNSSSAMQQENCSRQVESDYGSGAANQNMSTTVRASEDPRSSDRNIEHTRWGVLNLEKPHLYTLPLSQKHCPGQAKNYIGSLRGVKGRILKPFLLSMVAIAAVCVTVCILLKGPPEVGAVLSPFLWGSVRFGPQ